MKKTVYAKIYNTSGTIVKLFKDFQFSSFSQNLNSGFGDLQLIVAERFDTIASEIELGYELKIYVADVDAPSGQLVYDGLIDQINSQASNQESVEIVCSGYVHQLALDIVEDAQEVVISYTSTELSDIIRDILDKYQAVRGDDKITYTASSITDTGKNGSITFYASTPLTAIEQIKNLADADWYWRIDQNNVFYFQQAPTTATHLFVMGKDIASIEIQNDLREVRNGLLFSNGLTEKDAEVIFKMYKDTTSQSTYGRRIELKRDERYKASTGSADDYGDRFLNTYKDPLTTVRLQIIDNNLSNGYDIESIKVGDTCKVLNIGDNSNLTNNMLITRAEYNIDSMVIEVVDLARYVSREIENMRQRQQEMEFADNLPTSYT